MTIKINFEKGASRGSVLEVSFCLLEEEVSNPLPSDTKLLLTKNYFEIIIFEKLRIPRVISGKKVSLSWRF